MLPEGIPKIACPNNSTRLPPRKMAESGPLIISPTRSLCLNRTFEHSSPLEATHTLWITKRAAQETRIAQFKATPSTEAKSGSRRSTREPSGGYVSMNMIGSGVRHRWNSEASLLAGDYSRYDCRVAGGEARPLRSRRSEGKLSWGLPP